MKILAVFNRDGGTFRTIDMEDYCARATEVFESRGNAFTCHVVAGKEVTGALEAAAQRDDLDALVVGGGDGTVSTAAAICWRSGMPLGIVPAGTMNLFARTLQMPLDIDEALEALAEGRLASADIATANGRSFVHQYSVGLHSRMVRLRNSYQFRSRWGKMTASARAALQAALDPPVFETICRIDGKEDVRRAVSAISVSNNHFGADPLLIPDTFSGGELGVYLAGAMTPSGIAGLAFDILRGKLKENPAVSEFGARSVELSFPRLPKRANAVMDGELLPLESEVTIRLHAGELKVLVPTTAQ